MKSGKNNMSGTMLITFLFGSILLFASCKSQHEKYDIVSFTGEDIAGNYSRSLLKYVMQYDSIVPSAMVAAPGDLIWYTDYAFVYDKSDGETLNFKTSDQGGYVNNKIQTLELPDYKHYSTWLSFVDTADLTKLQFLKVDTLMAEVHPFLEKLSQTRKDVGIMIPLNSDEFSKLFDLFNPRYLIYDISASDFEDLSRMTNLELLVTSLEDSEPLPELPKLKQLIITSIDKKFVPDARFLSNNSSIQKICITEAKILDLSILQPLEDLRVLVISDVDSILNPEMLANHTDLEMVSLLNDKKLNSFPLEGLKKLRWIGFPGEATQQEFNSVITGNPGIEVAEICSNCEIKSIGQLSQLKNLYALTIVDTLTDIDALKSMKQLKYLSVPGNMHRSESIQKELKESLPDTRIVANEGFCLGSGWLLLILPLTILFHLARKKYQNARV